VAEPAADCDRCTLFSEHRKPIEFTLIYFKVTLLPHYFIKVADVNSSLSSYCTGLDLVLR
jgi:hypothetical protein